MGNARSSARSLASVHFLEAMDGDSKAKMYAEPLLGRGSAYSGGGREEEPRLQDAADDKMLDLGVLIHQLNCFFAVVWPVSIAIIFSSLAACHISDAATKQAMTTYMYYQDSPDLSVGTKIAEAFLNALLVIAFIAFLTFGIVLLYKLNCVQLFAGYCILNSAALLGVMGAKLVVIVLCHDLHLVVDGLSLAIAMYNFAVVGVLSIFYQKGIPGIVERGYLVSTSVIVAWQLAQLPEWSVWMLLLLLGFWDLFAVLTPMGPLRCLVDLVQEKGAPIPGLLFQANVENAHISAPVRTQGSKLPTLRQRKRATRDTVPEEVFVERLLRAATTSHSDLRVGVANLSQFGNQVKVFLHDQGSCFHHRSEELARAFHHNQLCLWRNFYSYYDVHFIGKNQPYPAVQSVFLTPVDRYQPEAQRCSRDQEDDEDDVKSIKLGLGDFIFYSVLVARAALHGFAVFAVCFLGIVGGLAITMYLLARFDALPALPISLFLGIVIYLLALGVLSPLLDEMLLSNVLAV